MRHNYEAELEKVGLSSVEAEIYLALLRNKGPMSAITIARVTGNSRSSVYLTLNSLIDIGIVEGDPGYGSRFSAVPPQQALPSLIERKRNEFLQCKHIADELANDLKALAPSPANDLGPEMIQVLRDPRAVLERFERLQFSAKRRIECFVKPPYFNRDDNQAEQKALQRGVRIRGIYERAGLENQAIAPHFHNWLTAGEEARVYDGELPHKMVIFDAQAVLMPLIMPGEQMRALLVRNQQLAQSLGLAFEHLWERSEPIERLLGEKRTTKPEKEDRVPQQISRNGRSGRPAKK